MAHKAAFLDRDGTLIRDAHYLSEPEQIEWLPGALELMKKLKENGYLLIVITNQSGIGRGYFNEDDYQKVTDTLMMQASEAGCPLDAVYHCPHYPEVDGPCHCRKPATGLFERAICDHDIDCAQSFAVGDRERDVKPALALGVTETYVVSKENGIAEVAEKILLNY